MIELIPSASAGIFIAGLLVICLLVAAFNLGQAFQESRSKSPKRRRLALTDDQVEALQQAGEEYDRRLKQIRRTAEDAYDGAKADLGRRIVEVVGEEARTARGWSLLRKSFIVYGLEVEED